MFAYGAICLSIRANRTRTGVRNVVIGLLVAEGVVDLLWAILYYHNGVYANYGIGAVYGLFTWIPALLVAAIVVTVRNKKFR